MARSARLSFRGVAVRDLVFCQAWVSERLLELGVYVSVEMPCGPPPTMWCPFAVLTRLVVAGGDGSPLGCGLAVEHGRRARVIGGTEHAIAGSFGSRELPKGGLGSRADLDA